MLLALYLFVTTVVLLFTTFVFIKDNIGNGYLTFTDGIIGLLIAAFAVLGTYLFVNQIAHISVSISVMAH